MMRVAALMGVSFESKWMLKSEYQSFSIRFSKRGISPRITKARTVETKPTPSEPAPRARPMMAANQRVAAVVTPCTI
ncbi:hypothetical protein D3C86_2151840 [compost metagenome]